MARDRDDSWYHRAFLNEERLLAAGLVRLVESAVVEITVQKQFERVSRMQSLLLPASQADRVTFYDQPEPKPPPEGTFVERIDRFPLRASLQVTTCGRCQGKGKRLCDDCNGTRQRKCSRCRGQGRELLWLLRCAGCEGTGQAMCSSCDEQGLKIDLGCGGEGKVASWETHVIEYSIRSVSEVVLPPDLPVEVQSAARDVVRSSSTRLAEVTTEAAATVLGYATPEVAVVMKRSDAWVNAQRGTNDTRAPRCLHLVPTARVLPLSSCRVLSESAQSAGDYWLIGRGEAAVERQPLPTFDFWKVGVVPSLLSGIILQRLVSSDRMDKIQTSVIPAVLLVLAGAALSITGVGLKRILFARRKRVRTVVVLPCSGARSSYLTCVGIVGSLAGKVEVLDHTYRGELQAMMGLGEPPSHSQSVAVRTASGDLVRLIEVARPEALSDAELSRVARAADGFVYLVETGHTEKALRGRVHRAAGRTRSEAVLRVEGGAPRTDPRGVTAEGVLALDVVRSAYTKQSDVKLDWLTVFTRLWAPIGTVLGGAAERGSTALPPV
jgi:hypothetical protein